MPRVRTSDIVKAQAKSIPAPTPVKSTYSKGDLVTELYEVEYHEYARKLVAAGIWKQRWADGEHYKTGDMLAKEHQDDIRLIKDLTKQLEASMARQAELLAAQAQTEKASEPVFHDSYTDFVERFDMVANTLDPATGGGMPIIIERRATEATHRLYELELNCLSTYNNPALDTTIIFYGPTVESVILEGHKLLDMMLDWHEAKSMKAKKEIFKKIDKFTDEED